MRLLHLLLSAGPTGAAGIDGSNSSRWQYDGDISLGLPGATYFYSDSTDLTLVTSLLFNKFNFENISYLAWFQEALTYVGSLNTGYLKVTEVGDSSVSAIYSINALINTLGGSYWSFGLTFLSGSGIFDLTKPYSFSWVFNGIDGPTGPALGTERGISYFTNNTNTTSLAVSNTWRKISGTQSLGTLNTPEFTSLPADILLSSTGDGGFENGSTFVSNGWTSVNDSTNAWYVGTTGANGAGNGAYISNDLGVNNAYTITTAQISHFYRDIVVPEYAYSITISFNIRVQGETGLDRLRLYITTPATTPVAGVSLGGGAVNYNLLGAGFTAQSAVSVNASVFTASNVRIVFSWENDNSIGTQPPASIDDIQIIVNPAPGLLYSGTNGTKFKATLTTTPLATAGITNFGTLLSINGITAGNQNEQVVNLSANFRESVVVSDLIELNSGDLVYPLINNLTSTTGVNVRDLHLDLIKIG